MWNTLWPGPDLISSPSIVIKPQHTQFEIDSSNTSMIQIGV